MLEHHLRLIQRNLDSVKLVVRQLRHLKLWICIILEGSHRLLMGLVLSILLLDLLLAFVDVGRDPLVFHFFRLLFLYIVHVESV